MLQPRTPMKNTSCFYSVAKVSFLGCAIGAVSGVFVGAVINGMSLVPGNISEEAFTVVMSILGSAGATAGSIINFAKSKTTPTVINQEPAHKTPRHPLIYMPETQTVN